MFFISRELAMKKKKKQNMLRACFAFHVDCEKTKAK